MPLYLAHVIVAVRELERAVEDYRSLDFTVIPGGVHSNGATHNALIAFAYCHANPTAPAWTVASFEPRFPVH
jgi:hypothetical protein